METQSRQESNETERDDPDAREKGKKASPAASASWTSAAVVDESARESGRGDRPSRAQFKKRGSLLASLKDESLLVDKSRDSSSRA